MGRIVGKHRRGLSARWSKRERDVMHYFTRKSDGHWLHYWWCVVKDDRLRRPGDPPPTTFMAELEARGFDITTLRFSCELKPESPPPAPPPFDKRTATAEGCGL